MPYMDPMQQQMLMRQMFQQPGGGQQPMMPNMPQGQGGMGIGPSFEGPDNRTFGVGEENPMYRPGGAQPLPMEGQGQAQPLPPYAGGGRPVPLGAEPAGPAPRFNMRGAEPLPPYEGGGQGSPLDAVPSGPAPRFNRRGAEPLPPPGAGGGARQLPQDVDVGQFQHERQRVGPGVLTEQDAARMQQEDPEARKKLIEAIMRMRGF